MTQSYIGAQLHLLFLHDHSQLVRRYSDLKWQRGLSIFMERRSDHDIAVLAVKVHFNGLIRFSKINDHASTARVFARSGANTE